MKFRLPAGFRLPDARPWPRFRMVGIASFVVERIGDLAPIERDSC